MRRIPAGLVLATSALLAAAAGCGGSGGSSSSGQPPAGSLSGAGSSLVYPLVSNWIPDYRKRTGTAVTYGPVGSGGGIEAITARTVDFGASDAPLTPDQAAACKGCVQIPWALSATTLSYNIDGLDAPLRLGGPTIAGIFLGAITRWNDPAIAALNPGVKLPDTPLTPVHRSDSSGDTFAFTAYLTKVSPVWRSKVGSSTSVSFPSGVGAKGNSGVAGVVDRTPGALGYVSVAYTVENHLDVASIENAAGNFVAPELPGIAAAATTGTPAADNAISIVDPPASAPGAYPVSTFTYAIVPKGSAKAAALQQFLRYAIGPGQQLAQRFVFAELPPDVVALGRRSIDSLGP